MERSRESPRAEISERLRFTREALGFVVQAAFAKKAGLTDKAYNNYENGLRIGLDAAIALCNKHGLSLDYIYFGERGNLPGSIIGKLDAHEARPRERATNKPRTRPFPRARSSASHRKAAI